MMQFMSPGGPWKKLPRRQSLSPSSARGCRRMTGGYSLRSSIACIPPGEEDRTCWDLFHRGRCPRRKNCCWYHPEEADMYRVKVNIRCTEETASVSEEEDQLLANVPTRRQTISLGDL